MSGVLFLNVLDAARSLGGSPKAATPASVADWLLHEYLARRGGAFNYNPAINCLFDLFSGHASVKSAIHHCRTTGNPKGRAQNADAIGKVGDYASGNKSRCYRIGFSAVAAGRTNGQTVYIGIKAPIIRVAGHKAFIVMPGFRMSHRPSEAEIDLACSIALATFGRDDFSEADFEYLYSGPGKSGTRELRVIHGQERNRFSRDDIDEVMEIYVRGVSCAIELGGDARKPNLYGYRIVDPSSPYFL